MWIWLRRLTVDGACSWSIDSSSRDIELYLPKDYTDAVDRMSWDNETNAFKYIIQQQFYEITPNPKTATTLYTGYNITSSKIITDDNILTMRSDLNGVLNTIDVIDYDVKDIRANVETLNSQMVETKSITKYLKEDIDKTKIISYTSLAFGIAGTVGSATSIGMQLSKSCIQFAAKGASGEVNPGTDTGKITGTTQGAGGLFRGIWTKIRQWFKGDGYVLVPKLHAEVLFPS